MSRSKLGKFPVVFGIIAGLGIALAGQANAMHGHTPPVPIKKEIERDHSTPHVPHDVELTNPE